MLASSTLDFSEELEALAEGFEEIAQGIRDGDYGDRLSELDKINLQSAIDALINT